MLDGKELSYAYNFFSGHSGLTVNFKTGWLLGDIPISDRLGEYINELHMTSKGLSVPVRLPSGKPKCSKCGGLHLCRIDNYKCVSCMVADMSPRRKAIIEGKQWYIPDTPCLKCGLLVERHVATGACSNCINKGVDRRATPESELMRAEPNAIISKEQAKTMGLKIYRTGRPCTKGHTGWRYVSTNSCIDCLRSKK